MATEPIEPVTTGAGHGEVLICKGSETSKFSEITMASRALGGGCEDVCDLSFTLTF